jgi:hypothetical protein
MRCRDRAPLPSPKPRRHPCPKPVAVRPSSVAAEPVFSPSPSTRSSGELSPPPPCLAGSLTAVGAQPPPFAPPLPLWRRRRPRRDAHPESGDHSGVRRAIVGHAGRGRPGKSRPRAAHTGRAPRGHGPCTRYARGPSRRRERGPHVQCATGPSAVSALWQSI